MNKCDKCGREARVHLTEIIDGQKTERHLCEDCAVSEGVTVKAHLSISEILEELVLQSAAGKELSRLKCDICGISFLEFRQGGLLGCPNDYNAFEDVLARLLKRTTKAVRTTSARHPPAQPRTSAGRLNCSGCGGN